MAKIPDSNPCKGCPALCCKFVAVELDEPESEKDWDEIKWMLCHENITVYKDNDGDWLVEFATNCRMLDEKNHCKIYDKRPKLCREHDPESCVTHGEGDVHIILFEKPEDVDEYRELLKKGPVEKFPVPKKE
ncbi:YkgJ family cysteine cluster protein [Candidatus Woesearchaeota archaeon]|nr:YkgJ family cysteine cluster protein [Candidatus Woesearchaeota archaeon]